MYKHHKLNRFTFLYVAVMALPQIGSATTSYFLETSQSGAEVTISISGSDTWVFTPDSSWDLGGGIFSMKRGPSVIQNIVLTLNDVTDSLNNIASVALAPASVTQSYGSVTMAFSTPFTVSAGITYNLVLSSSALSSNNTEYFIKDNGNSGFFDQQGNPLPVTSSSAVPEPSSGLMSLGAALLLFGFGSKRLRRQS